MKLKAPVKSPTWKELLAAIPFGESDYFPISYAGTIRAIISREMKWHFPDRVFKTYEDKENGALVVTCKPAEAA